MQVQRAHQSVSGRFIENVQAVWQRTPQDVERSIVASGWNVLAGEISRDDGQTIALVSEDNRTLTYFEYCTKDGRRRRTPLDAMTHYHELIHIMDAELQSDPVTGALQQLKNINAFKLDQARIPTGVIHEHNYFLDIDRFDETPPRYMSAETFGWLRACDETRAEAGAEMIVHGGGPISSHAPITTQRVLRDIGRTWPSLLRLSPARLAL